MLKENFSDNLPLKKASHRQLRMAEEVRKVLSEVFAREEIYSAVFSSSYITITHVDISPDLKNATLYVMPLGGKNQKEVMEFLKDNIGPIRHYLSKKLIARHTPRLVFKIDLLFDQADKMNALFQKVEQGKDTGDCDRE